MKKRIQDVKERRDKSEKALATFKEAKGDDVEIPALKDLEFDSYERCYGEIEGCSELCECRKMAMGYGEEIVAICVDPSRRRSLKAKQSRKEKQGRREVIDAQRDAFWNLYFPCDFNWTPAALRLIARRTIAQGSSAKAVRNVLDELLSRGHIDDNQREALEGLAGGMWDKRGPGLDAFEQLPMDSAMMLILACLMEKEFLDAIEYAGKTESWGMLEKSEPYVCAQTPV